MNKDKPFENAYDIAKKQEFGLITSFHFKGTVMQTEEALISITYVFQKYPEDFPFQLFLSLQ